MILGQFWLSMRTSFVAVTKPGIPMPVKGDQWYFGLEAHFGVDSCSKLIHAAFGDISQCRRQCDRPMAASGR